MQPDSIGRFHSSTCQDAQAPFLDELIWPVNPKLINSGQIVDTAPLAQYR